MAIAVIGGLMSSTLLSLVFVPAVFALMDDVGKLAWMNRHYMKEAAPARIAREARSLPS